MRRGQGRVRPELPRRRELRVVAASEKDAREGRDSSGRFATGNRGARNRGWKLPLAKLLGRDPADPIAARVASDAFKTYCAELRELPSDGPIVRSLAAQHAHHVALAAFWGAQAFDRGLATPEGIEAQEHALKHGQRAERLAVTMLDVAARMVVARQASGHDTSAALAAGLRRIEADRVEREREVAEERAEDARTSGEDLDPVPASARPVVEPEPVEPPELCERCGAEITRPEVEFCLTCGAKRPMEKIVEDSLKRRAGRRVS